MLQKWMPGGQRVAIDSSPKLHGIWDTINATLATPLRLPTEFYDARVRSIIDRAVTEEEYVGYKESLEYRTLGIGALMGELVGRIVEKCKPNTAPGVRTRTGSPVSDDMNDQRGLRIALLACHDSTLAAILASLGALEGEDGSWPSYTASLAVDFFVDKNQRKPTLLEDTPMDRGCTNGYVRIRYNDRPITLPGCRTLGRHLDGDESFCTLVMSS